MDPWGSSQEVQAPPPSMWLSGVTQGESYPSGPPCLLDVLPFGNLSLPYCLFKQIAAISASREGEMSPIPLHCCFPSPVLCHFESVVGLQGRVCLVIA